MGRKNCNAQKIYQPPESWISLLPYDGRIKLRPQSYIKITGESVVREHRNSSEFGRYDRSTPTGVRSIGPVDPDRSSETKPEKTHQPYRVLPQAGPSAIRRGLDRINWGRAFDYACIGLAVLAIAAVSGVFFFGPKGLLK